MTMLDSLLAPGHALREVDNGIYSAIGERASRESEYDSLAAGYDFLIANRFYNRVLWGNWPSAYSAYCRDALRSSAQGWVLDAGCGTLVFTAEEYLRQDARPTVLLDSSLGMLRRARARLAKGHKSPPEHITLVQGDLTALPFKPRAFTTVNCWGVLHLFDDPVAVVEELERVVASAGRLFCTSLVTGRALGSWYQRILADRGISARPMDSGDLTARLRAAGFAPECYVRGSMAYLSVPRRMSEA